jgi:hypothetical protein
MQRMINFGSIEQFRNVIKRVQAKARYVGQDDVNMAVFDNSRELPIIKATGSEKIHGCFEKNSLVTLANGESIPISKITEGTYILSYNHKTQEQEVKKVLKSINQKLNKEWCKLVFDNTEIICTKDHKIWTDNRGYIEAQYLDEFDIFQTV